MAEGIGDEYQRETKYFRERMPVGMLDWSTRPELYKEYPDSKVFELPPPEASEDLGFDELLKRRKSVREFSPEGMSTEQLSYLLWASTGIQRVDKGYEFRTAPSAGALYPIETYLVANRVDGLEQGLYHYAIKRHRLEQLKTGDLSLDVAKAALDQIICYRAAAVIIWSALFYRSKWKYGQRGYRYIYMDAGHIGENLYLAATNLGLGVCTIGALYDDELNRLVGLDGEEESAIYMAVVGRPA